MSFAFNKYRKPVSFSTDASVVGLPSLDSSFSQVFTENTGQSSYTTSNISPPTGKAYIAFVYDHRSGTHTDDPSLSGLGLTWTKEYSVNASDPGTRHSIFKGVGTPTSGTVTITLNHSSGFSCGFGFVVLSNVNTTSPIVQTHRSEEFASQTLSSSLSSFSNARNIGVSFATCGAFRSAGQINYSGGYTEISGRHLTDHGVNDNYDMSVNMAIGPANDNAYSVDYTITNEWKWNLTVEAAAI